MFNRPKNIIENSPAASWPISVNYLSKVDEIPEDSVLNLYSPNQIVTGHYMCADKSEGLYRLQFSVTDPQEFENMITSVDGDIVREGNKYITGWGILEITENKVLVKSRFPDGLAEVLYELGLISLTLEPEISPDLAKQLIDRGGLIVGDRVVEVEEKVPGDIYDKPSSEDKMIVYHGTGLTAGLSICRDGFYSGNTPKIVNPTLTSRPDLIAAKLAENQWQESYPRGGDAGYGVILCFEVDPIDIREEGGNINSQETMYQPARDQANGQDGKGFLDRSKIKKIYLVRQG